MWHAIMCAVSDLDKPLPGRFFVACADLLYCSAYIMVGDNCAEARAKSWWPKSIGIFVRNSPNSRYFTWSILPTHWPAQWWPARSFVAHHFEPRTLVYMYCDPIVPPLFHFSLGHIATACTVRENAYSQCDWFPRDLCELCFCLHLCLLSSLFF